MEHPELSRAIYARANVKRSASPEHLAEKRARELRRNYGLSPADFADLLESQGGRCAICRKGGRLHVDHDHATGVVRGLLCGNCNTALGLLHEDLRVMQDAIEYLSRLPVA